MESGLVMAAKKLKQPIDNNTVIRKPEVKLYCYLDEDYSFTPPPDIEDLMLTIDAMVENDDLPDNELGMYYAIQQLLAIPAALMLQTAKKMLEDIVEEGVENSIANEEDDDLDEEDDIQTEQAKEEAMSRRHHHNTQYVSPNVDNPAVPMSLLDLNEWYRSTDTGVIEGFYSATHEVKYSLYLKHKKEKERASRDLTDEEMLEELEGPEQSD